MPGEAGGASPGGRHGSEDAGMSSERAARNRSAENPRFPGLGLSSQGKAGPKPRAKAVGDGQPVNIPVPRRDVMYGVTQ